MTSSPKRRFVVCSLAILFIFLRTVTGNGFAFDSVSCSRIGQPDLSTDEAANLLALSTEFLTFEMRRASMIARNTAGAMRVDIAPNDVKRPIYNVMRYTNEYWFIGDALSAVKKIFTGGRILIPNTVQYPDIPGTASLTQELPNFDSRESPDDNAADRQGNLVSVPVVSWRTALAIQDTDSSHSSSSVTTHAWVGDCLKIPYIRHTTLVWTRVEMN